jgi:putative FmdB family regulatory protein
MPTYEYECTACGKHLEHFQSMKDAPIRKCPKCGKLRLKRLISGGVGVIFKGSGFYTTDYRSSSYNESKKSDSAEPATKSDVKTEKTEKTEAGGKPAGATDGGQATPTPAPSKKSKGSKK